MKIKEVSYKTGLSKDMIRFYEKLNLISPSRNKNKYREYSNQDANKIILIKQFNNLGIDLKTVQKLLKNNDLEESISKLNISISTLENQLQWITNRIKLAEDINIILNDLSLDIEYRIIKNTSFFFYNHDSSEEYHTLLSKTNGLKFSYRIKSENINLDKFPDDIGLISFYKIKDVKLNYKEYTRKDIFRTYLKINEDKLVDKHIINNIKNKLKQLNKDIRGDIFISQIINNNYISTICIDTII